MLRAAELNHPRIVLQGYGSPPQPLIQKQVVKKDSFEAAQLTAADLDTMCIAVLADLLFGDAVFCSNGECLGTGYGLLDSCTLECLCNFICVHGNNILCISS